MRAAILISGYLRTFKLNLPSLEEKILSKFDKIDVYLHLTNDEYQDRYLNQNNDEDIRNVIKILSPKVILIESNSHYGQNPKENDIYNTWGKLYKLNKIKQEYEKVDGEYDIVIRYRPDINMVSDLNFELDNINIILPKDSKIDIGKLENVNDNYVCDIFAYGKSKLMDYYFSIYNNLSELIKEHGYVSETILFHHLKKSNYVESDINYNVILSTCNTFAICGDSGSGKTTLGSKLKKYFSKSFMLECDRYHKWERNDENWKSFTHLNPDANYLTKMNKDIFDLKIGNSIFQVDYDHKTGKFTQKEKIDSTDNLIVCGLHSLYNNNDSLYNLKIYMDTDINLRKKWKIERDINKRGYTKEKIIDQINSRETDYKKYIETQKSKSDIIVNFHTNKTFDIDNIEGDLPIRLNILLRKKIPVENILLQLFNEGIDFDIDDSDNEFNIIKFKEYGSFKRTLYHNQYDNYYDYIIFVIMSLNKIN